jgi:hypothetical protein
MDLSHKLDVLQDMAIRYADKPFEMHLICLLAEHADEDEMTVEFVQWIRALIGR